MIGATAALLGVAVGLLLSAYARQVSTRRRDRQQRQWYDQR